jgi:hypothetical protein
MSALNRLTVNMPDIFEVISENRPEMFPFERQIALMTLSVWLHCPHEPILVKYGQVKAAAKILSSIRNNTIKLPAATRKNVSHAIFAALFTEDLLPELLLKVPFTNNFEIEFWQRGKEIELVQRMSDFLITCPVSLKPSLNKAFFFISEGGFLGTASTSAMKKIWSRFACVSPFATAATLLQIHYAMGGKRMPPVGNIFDLAPDHESAINKVKFLTEAGEIFSEYFGVVRFVQETIISLIGGQVRNEMGFVTFPESIKTVSVDVDSFDDRQLQIIHQYRAPKLI